MRSGHAHHRRCGFRLSTNAASPVLPDSALCYHESPLQRTSAAVAKEMNSDLQNLIELQKLDDEIRDLSAEVANLPRQIAAIESQLKTHIQQVESDKQALSENQKSRRKREGEIASQRDKISHLKDQSLQVKTNEQYKAMLHEIEFHEQQIRKIEDQILGEMMESENLERKVREAEQKLAEERKRAQAEIAVAEQRKAEQEDKLRQAQSARASVAGTITIDVYETYQRIARGRKGQAVVTVLNGTCGGCHVHLRPQILSEAMSNEQILTCESCGRILLYVPPPPSADASAASESAG